MTATEIARRADGVLAAGSPDAIATSWEFDSRKLEPGACFVALHGNRDGHDFVADALHEGASVALVSRPLAAMQLHDDQALVQVDDVVDALQALATAMRAERPDLRVVAVTGSTGKTSTKDLLAAVLAPLGGYANAASFNNEFGLPLTMLNAPERAPMIVTEMGERFPGDIAALCAIAKPDVGVVTNVGLAHAEHLGGPDGVAEVLAELLEALPASGLAVLNADDEHTPALAARTSARVVTVGQSATADFRVDSVSVDERARASFVLADTQFSLQLHGAHHVGNAALAAVVGHVAFDVTWSDAARRIGAASSSHWRMDLTERSDGTIVINDAYNASPDSMHAALHALASLAVPGRRLAVLGDMRELGVHSVDAHRHVGRLAATLKLDALIAVGDLGALIAEGAGEGVAVVRSVADANAALAAAREIVEPGDAVLVKASRAMDLQEVAVGLLAQETTAP
jgi:UDP-N-acetylmuramoyl-tripeptide--D-alanyl-D-alanine ligase